MLIDRKSGCQKLIKALRKRGLSTQAIAWKSNCSEQYIFKILAGTRNPSDKLIREIAEIPEIKDKVQLRTELIELDFIN